MKADWFLRVAGTAAVLGLLYLAFITYRLDNCVSAKEESGKMYNEIKECRYIFDRQKEKSDV